MMPGKSRREPNWRGFSVSLAMLLLAPIVAGLLIAFAYPVGKLLSVSLFNPTFSIEQYTRVFSASLYSTIILRTFRIAGAVTVIALFLAYPVALMMSRLSGIRLMAMAACVMVPLWTSVLVRSYAWIIILQRNGIVNQFLQSVGLTKAPLDLLYNEFAVLVAMVHVLLPYMVLPIWAALRTIPADLPKAAAILGANRASVFRAIVLPLSLPGVFSGILMVFILSLGFYITPALVGGADTLMIATLIGQQTTELLNWPFAGALAAVLLLATLIMVGAFSRFMNISKQAAS